MKKAMPLKERIITEALRLFSVKGYMSTSTTDIIEAAGTSKGGFYNHFRSKEQLFMETLSAARKIWRDRNLFGLDDIDRPLEKLEALLRNYGERYLSDAHSFPGGCIFVNLVIELSDQAPTLAAEVNEGFVRLKGMIRRIFDEEKRMGGIPADTDTADLTELVFTALLGACVMYTADKSKQNLDRAIASLVAYIRDLDERA
jgi:AcrR family transcriptional regulator